MQRALLYEQPFQGLREVLLDAQRSSWAGSKVFIGSGTCSGLGHSTGGQVEFLCSQLRKVLWFPCVHGKGLLLMIGDGMF